MLDNLILTRPLSVLDLETTGTDPFRDRIVEVAVLRLAPAQVRRRLSMRVNPAVAIPPGATAVHGITDADVAECPTFAQISSRLARVLEGCDLCGFGLKRFDLLMLAAEFSRAGVAFGVTGRRVIDVLEIFHSREPRDLSAAHRLYVGAELTGDHGATADVRATGRVLEGMLRYYPEMPRRVDLLQEEFAGPDVAGRFRLEGGDVVFASGKHQGRPVVEVARREPGYLRWMLDGDFLDDRQGDRGGGTPPGRT